MIFAILFLFVAPSEIKQQTQHHLRALQSISATEKVGKFEYEVAMFGNRQQGVAPPRVHGPFPLQAWSVLLRDSLFWKYEVAGDHFTFKDLCEWQENGRQIIPCAGRIYHKSLDISSIIITYSTKKWGEVTLQVDYDFVTLSEPRLVPTKGVLRWRGGETSIAWSEYREFRGTEPVVSEVEADDETTMEVEQGNQRSARQADNETKRAVVSRSVGVPLPAFDSDDLRPEHGQRTDGNVDATFAVLTPRTPTKVTTVKGTRPWWKKIFIRERTVR